MTRLRGLFVTGTDTGAGKTVVAAAIVASLRAGGEAVAAFKPVVTGLGEPRDPDWPPDHELLAAAAGSRPDAVTPHRFGPAVSPHLAAEMAGRPLEGAELVAVARRAAGDAAAGGTPAGDARAGDARAGDARAGDARAGDARAGDARAGDARPGDARPGEGPVPSLLIVEGVGGLLVPLTGDFLVRDLAIELGLPLVVSARPGLGTINHTLLTVEAARAVGLLVAAVVLGPWPEPPGQVETSNRATIERLAGVEVATLPRVQRATPALLAAAAGELPVTRWLG